MVINIVHKPKPRRKELLTDDQKAVLTANGITHYADHDSIPCVYLLGKHRSYLLSEINPENSSLVFGIMDANDGNIVSAYHDINDIYDYHDNKDFLFNDLTFNTNHKLSVFERVAQECGQLVVRETLFQNEFAKYSNE